MEPTKNLKDYIKKVQEREDAKAMTDEALKELKKTIENEQIRRAVVRHIEALTNTTKQPK